MGGGSTTNSNTASNQASNSATNFATQMQQAQSSNTSGNYGQNAVTQNGPTQAALDLINQSYGPISQDSIQGYMSPYLTQVVNATMGQQQQNNAVQQQALKGNAISQNALGGDRAKVAQAELMRGQGLNDASTIANLYNTGYGQALTAAQADRAAALQAAGMMGTQGSTSTAGTSSQATNAMTNALTQGSQAQANAGSTSGTGSSATSQNQGIGQYAGLAMSALALMSDKRAKENIQKIGKAFDGQHIYRFNYKGDPKTHIGLIAQEVEQKHPEAVGSIGGLKAVNYDVATHEAAQRKRFMDGGAITRRADGGFIIPNGGVPSGFGALQAYQVQPYQAPQSGGQKSSQPSMSDMQKLGKQARVGLDRLMGGSDSSTGSDAASMDGMDTAAASGGAGGMDSMGMLSAAGKGSGGAVRGFASGGTTVQAPAQASMPNIPAATASTPTMPSITPVAFSPTGQTSGGKWGLGDSSQSMVPMPTISMPYVPQAYVPQASAGKGSGGAVRGFADGGDTGIDSTDNLDWAKLFGQTTPPQQLAENTPVTGMAVPGYTPAPLNTAQNVNNYLANLNGEIAPYPAETGGRSAADLFQQADTPQNGVMAQVPAVSSSSATDLPAFQKFLAAQQDAHTAANPGLVQPAQRPISSDVATAPQNAVAAQAPAVAAPATLAPDQSPTGLGALATLPDTANTVKPEIYSPDGTQIARPVIAPSAAPAPQGLGALQDTSGPLYQNIGKKDVARIAADEFKSAGMSDNATRGILANIRDESGFDPTLRRPDQPKWGGEAHYAHGLVQMGGAEWNNYAAWLEKNAPGRDWQDPQLQARFTAQNLQENYPGTWEKMNNASAEDAAKIFVSEYEKPAARFEAARREKYGQGVPGLEDIINGAKGGLGALANGASEAATGVVRGVGDVASGAGNAVSTLGEGLKNIFAKGTDTSGTLPQHPYKSTEDQKSGLLSQGLLSRFGINFNPLNLTSQDRMTMLSIAAGMMQPGGNIGTGLAAGINYQQAQNQQARQAQLDAMKLNMELSKMTQPVVIGEYQDSLGQTHKQYGAPSINAATGKMTWPAVIAPGTQAAGNDLKIGSGQHGEEYLSSIDTSNPRMAAIVAQARDVLSGREKLTAITKANPTTSVAVQQMVRQADPTYNENRYKYHSDWESPNGAVGKTRIANNTGIQHMGELSNLVDKMPDSGLGPLSSTSTHLQKWWRGHSNDPVMADWAANAQVLAGEVAKVNVGGQTAMSDRNEILESLNPARGREALNATLAKYVKLFAGKTESLDRDYKKTVGPFADEAHAVDPENQPILDRLKARYMPNGGASASGQAAATSQASIPTVSGADEAKALIQAGKLKSGDQFIDEHGITRMVH